MSVKRKKKTKKKESKKQKRTRVMAILRTHINESLYRLILNYEGLKKDHKILAKRYADKCRSLEIAERKLTDDPDELRREVSYWKGAAKTYMDMAERWRPKDATDSERREDPRRHAQAVRG